MSCRKFECEDHKENICCFECPDFAECYFSCEYAFKEGLTRDCYKSDCEYYESDEVWSWNETYSDDWTHGTFISKEEALKDALGTKKAFNLKLDKVSIGRCVYVPVRTDVDPDRVMEDLDELYCDETGCDYYIYEGVTDEQRKWLEDKLSDVMNEFHEMIGLKSSWFTVVEQEEIDLNEYEKEK